jgi:phosphoribosylformimino-5-aminoimidazole carboxamide ribotide isomerase
MIAIPAIDLRDGACVQLVGGDYAAERVRLPDPAAVARGWAEHGFTRLHVVDLDAATGRGSNATVIEQLLHQDSLDLQVGGGLRTTSAVDGVLDNGARYAVVSSRALEDFEWFAELCSGRPGAIVLAIDVRERQVVTRGWLHSLPRDILELVEQMEHLPLAGLLVTAVHREGQMQGTDLRLMEDVVEVAHTPVLAAGGVGSMGDLWALEDRGVAGVVIGMALYTGALDPRAVTQEFSQ